MARMTPSLTLLALAGGGLLAGCAHTDPGRGADLTYHLPSTAVSADLSLTLVECGEALKVDVEAAISAKAGAQDKPIHVSAASLASSRIQRDLTITTGDDLVISGVNSSATDQTATIISNIAKTLVTVGVGGGVAPSAAGGKKPSSLCTAAALAALARVKLLDARILQIQELLAGGASPGDAGLVRELKARFKERGDLKANLLLVKTSAPVKLPDGPDPAQSWAGTLAFRPEPFRNWFGPDVSGTTVNQLLPVSWTATRQAPPTPGAATRRLRTCRQSLQVPAPANVVFQIKGDAGTESGVEKINATEVFPVAQLDPPTDLCIDVGFGETRTIEVAFDKFGRTTKLHWASAATAANVTGAIAGVAPDVKTLLAKTPETSTLDQQKAEIERLKTQQEYNALKACEAVIAAGGSDCSADSQ